MLRRASGILLILFLSPLDHKWKSDEILDLQRSLHNTWRVTDIDWRISPPHSCFLCVSVFWQRQSNLVGMRISSRCSNSPGVCAIAMYGQLWLDNRGVPMAAHKSFWYEKSMTHSTKSGENARGLSLSPLHTQSCVSPWLSHHCVESWLSGGGHPTTGNISLLFSSKRAPPYVVPCFSLSRTFQISCWTTETFLNPRGRTVWLFETYWLVWVSHRKKAKGNDFDFSSSGLVG